MNKEFIDKYEYKEYQILLDLKTQRKLDNFLAEPLLIYNTQTKLNQNEFFIISEKNNKINLDYFNGEDLKNILKDCKSVKNAEEKILNITKNQLRDFTTKENDLNLTVCYKNKLGLKNSYYKIQTVEEGYEFIKKIQESPDFQFATVENTTNIPIKILSAEKNKKTNETIYDLNCPILQEKVLYNNNNLPDIIRSTILLKKEKAYSIINDKNKPNKKFLVTLNQNNNFNIYQYEPNYIERKNVELKSKNEVKQAISLYSATPENFKFLRYENYIVEKMPVRFNELNNIQKFFAILYETEKQTLENNKTNFENTKDDILKNPNNYDFSSKLCRSLIFNPKITNNNISQIKQYINTTMDLFLYSNRNIKKEVKKIEEEKKKIEEQYSNLNTFIANMNKTNPDFNKFTKFKKLMQNLKEEQIDKVFESLVKQTNDFRTKNEKELEKQRVHQNQKSKTRRK